MFKLVLKKHNEIVQEEVLASDTEYIVGRNPDASIVLDAETGISREHLSINIKENNQIEIKLLSKSGKAFIDGEPLDSLITETSTKVAIFPYTICIEAVSEEEIKNHLTTIPTVGYHGEPEALEALDQTTTNFTQIEIYLSVTGDDLKKQFKLTGDTWTVGRDENCDITINHPQLSRRHFEIKREQNDFIIFDLDSSNGTQVNGQQATASHPLKLKISDKITVEDLNFEISEFDSLFEESLNSAQSSLAIPGSFSGSIGMPLPPESIGANVLKVNRDGSTSKVSSNQNNKFNKKTIIRSVIGLAFIGIMYVGLAENKTDDRAPASTESAITQEQKAFFRDTLQLAKHHFIEGRYSLCSSEISKIHSSVDTFENSKDISELCKEAAQREKILADERRKKEQRSKVQDDVEKVLVKCRAIAKSSRNVAELSVCLEPVIDLDPTNIEAQELVQILTNKLEDERAQHANQKKRAQLLSKSRSRFKAAKSLYTKGELKSARTAYKKYLKSGLPDPGGLKPEAKRDIASINTEIESLINTKVEDCKSKMDAGSFKAAIDSCNIALNEDKGNETAKTIRKSALLQLRRNMQEIYQKSILEENYGNLHAAQTAWKDILAKDSSDGEYYLKAKVKLKKYGL